MSTTTTNTIFDKRKTAIQKEFQLLIEKKNEPQATIGNGIFDRYKNPVVTRSNESFLDGTN
jgi:4-O-beta-D-mannosyl-D-glucose phosphorylase